MSMRLLYDSDALDNGRNRRTFTVTEQDVASITAVGLAVGEVAAIYVRAGASNATRTSAMNNTQDVDYKWAPLIRCGAPVQLSSTNNQLIESVPGVYTVGNPDVPLTFAGDVNISLIPLGVEFRRLPGECGDAGPQAVSVVDIVSSCADPVFVELCNPQTTLVETALAELGCVIDPVSGVLTGKVMVQRIDDEDAGTTVYETTLFNVDGTRVSPYTGAWGLCQPGRKTNQARASGIVSGPFDLAAAVAAGAEVSGYSVSFLDADGAIDGVTVPRGVVSWSAEPDQQITNVPAVIASSGRIFIKWTERS